MSDANSIQHGGDHYKGKAIEPWDYIHANGLGFFEGNAIKYLTRWKSKGGVEDLKKAKHYIEKLIELESTQAKGASISNVGKTKYMFECPTVEAVARKDE